MIGWVTNVNECKWEEKMSMDDDRMRNKQSLFRRAEQPAGASCFGSTWRPLSIILIIETRESSLRLETRLVAAEAA